VLGHCTEPYPTSWQILFDLCFTASCMFVCFLEVGPGVVAYYYIPAFSKDSRRDGGDANEQ
jgi:hypothetical protein